jgi:hypothetical protein
VRRPLGRKDYFVFGMSDRTNPESNSLFIQIRFNIIEIFFGKLIILMGYLCILLKIFKGPIKLLLVLGIILVW